MPDLKISVDGGDGEFVSLSGWLAEKRELRGVVKVEEPPIGETQLGSLPEVLTVLVSSGGLATALASSLKAWLLSRQTTARITVRNGERAVTLDMTSVEDIRPLIERVLSSDVEAD